MNAKQKAFRHYYFRELIAELDKYSVEHKYGPLVLRWPVARTAWKVATKRAKKTIRIEI